MSQDRDHSEDRVALTPTAARRALGQRQTARLSAVLMAAVALAACGGGGGGGAPAAAPPSVPSPPPPPPPAAPAITVQPVGQTVSVGQTAVFTVQATGSGLLAYQWLRNGVAIAGATGSSYTTPALALADDGVVFSVAVTTAGGTTTSAGAVLRVSAATGSLTPVPTRLSLSNEGYLLAVHDDGRVLHWGGGMQGGLGSALPGTVARVIGGVSGAVGVASDHPRSLVVTASGGLMGWGRNWRGALGVTHNGDDNLVINAAVAVGQVSGVVQARACGIASFALRNDGSVWLLPAVRSLAGAVSARPVAGLAGIVRLAQVSTGFSGCNLLAIDGDGRVWLAIARDGDYDGVLQQTVMITSVEQDLRAPAGVRDLSCSEVIFDANTTHCLAITADGSVWAWGDNGGGRLGTGDTVSRTLPVRLTGLPAVRQVAVTIGRSYLLTESGQVWAWGGFNGDALMGGRTAVTQAVGYSDFWVPGPVPSISDVEYLAAAQEFVTVMKRDGTVWSWGSNLRGVFGDGLAGTYTGVPTQALGISLK